MVAQAVRGRRLVARCTAADDGSLYSPRTGCRRHLHDARLVTPASARLPLPAPPAFPSDATRTVRGVRRDPGAPGYSLASSSHTRLIQVVVESISVGRPRRRPRRGAAWVDEILDDELEVHYAKAWPTFETRTRDTGHLYESDRRAPHRQPRIPGTGRSPASALIGAGAQIAAGSGWDEALTPAGEQGCRPVLPGSHERAGRRRHAALPRVYRWDRLSSPTDAQGVRVPPREAPAPGGGRARLLRDALACR